MTAYSVVWSEAVNLWACGTYVCIRLPLKTIHILWETQLFLIYLPFRCAYRLFRFVFPSNPETKEKELLKTIMCCDLDDKNKVLNAFHEIQASSFLAVNKVNSFNARKRNRRKQIKKERVTPQRSQISYPADEKSNLNERINRCIEPSNVEAADGVVTDENLNIMVDDLTLLSKRTQDKASQTYKHDRLVVTSIHNFLKSCCDILRSQAENMRDLKTQCADVASEDSGIEPCTFESINEVLLDVPSNNSNLRLSDSVDKLQAIAHLLNVENFHLKEHLKTTNDQLNDIRTTTTCLSQKVLNLEVQLDQVRSILHNVATDRDTMQKKLLILQQMIEEEEIYLNDDSSRDDSFSELYVTTQDYNFHDLIASSPLENRSSFTESDNESWEKQDLK